MGIYIKNIFAKIVFLIMLFVASYAVPQGNNSAPVESGSQSLVERTIAIDIDTASYFELVAWSRQLGLDTSGSRRDLQQRLLSHYQQAERIRTAGTGKNVFIIESAEKTEYFTIEKIDEDYIIISGDVVIRIENNEDGTTHTIRTNKIVFNQKNNLMTADGNVTYVRKTNNDEEVFTGRKLSFNVENWEGIFIESRSQHTSEQEDGSELTFIYSGDMIYKDNDIIIIDNARITSSNPDNPNYSIKAQRVWVLAPNEWGLKNAVLYVGHVPMFYFPFFFHPGDSLVFNPAFGIKQPIGYFMQTTTYLFGSPRHDSETALLSFSNDSLEYETELSGIFLRKIRKKEDTTPDDQYIKIMFDIYSRLGLFVGTEGKTDVIDFYFGLARSRNIYIGSNGMYSVFYENSDGEFSTTWNDANLLNITVPFRYGMELDMQNTFRNFKFDLSIDFYSDPFFLRDFNDRAELTDWSRLIGLEDEIVDTTMNIDVMDRLWWYFHGSYRYPEKIFNGIISEISITKFDFSMNWRNHQQSGFGIDIPSYALTEYFFPEQYFYYPEYYTFPDVSMTIRGDIFSKSIRSPRRAEPSSTGEQRQSSALISPLGARREKTEIENRSISNLSIISSDRMPDESIKAFRNREFFYHSMRYTISPNVSVTETMETMDQDSTPSDISFQPAYTETRTYGRADLFYSANLYDDFVSFDNNIIFTGDYRTHSNRSDSIDDSMWDSFLLRNYRASYLKIENRSTVTTFPLYRYEMYDQSFVRYHIDIVGYKTEFDELDADKNPIFRSTFFTLEEEYFTRHETEVHLKYFSWWNQMQQFRVRVIHPPFLQSIENENIIRTGPLTSTTIFQMNEEVKGLWVPGNFIWRERLAYDPRTYIEHTLIYDGYNDELDTSQTVGRISFLADEIFLMTDFRYGFKVDSPLEFTTTLNLWVFQTQYIARRQYPVYYVQGEGWRLEQEEKFVPSQFFAKVDFSRYFMPVWKNRVRYKTNLVTTWKMDLQEFTENAFVVDLGFDFRIHKFLNIHFNAKSENNATYRYIPSLARQLEEEWVNPVADLLKSFNFFNTDDRYESFFKLKQLDFKIVHNLGDWDLSLQYTGKPDLFQSLGSGVPEWRWTSEATIMIQWNPIKQIKTEVRRTSEDGFTTM